MVVSFELLKQRKFSYGQMYVALSRVTTLASLYIVGSFNVNVRKVSPQALEEYNKMRSCCKLLNDFNFKHYSNDLENKI